MNIIYTIQRFFRRPDFFDVQEGLIGGELLKAYKDFEKIFPKAVLVGGLAVDQYIEDPCFTGDVDVLVDEKTARRISTRNFDNQITSLKFKSRFRPSKSQEKGDIIRRKSGVPIDLKNPGTSGLLLHLINDIDTYLINKGGIRIMKPEAIIAMKSIRPIEDPSHHKTMLDEIIIADIFRNHPDLDIQHLTHLLPTKCVELIEDLRKEALMSPLRKYTGGGIAISLPDD